jgi:hypothetical protein
MNRISARTWVAMTWLVAAAACYAAAPADDVPHLPPTRSASAWPSSLTSQKCNIYVHTLDQQLSAHRYPAGWPDHQYAMEHHLAIAARTSPWRVSSRKDADLVVVLANYSLYCVAGKTFSRRGMWFKMLNDRTIWDNASTATFRGEGSVFVGLQASACGVPWVDYRGSFAPRNLLQMTEVSRGPHQLVPPFVISKPEWLVGEGAAHALPAAPWRDRKLLFFAGHVVRSSIES